MLLTTDMTKFWKYCEMWNRAHNIKKNQVFNHGKQNIMDQEGTFEYQKKDDIVGLVKA